MQVVGTNNSVIYWFEFTFLLPGMTNKETYEFQSIWFFISNFYKIYEVTKFPLQQYLIVKQKPWIIVVIFYRNIYQIIFRWNHNTATVKYCFKFLHSKNVRLVCNLENLLFLLITILLYTICFDLSRGFLKKIIF